MIRVGDHVLVDYLARAPLRPGRVLAIDGDYVHVQVGLAPTVVRVPAHRVHPMEGARA